jgi:hypothetical protein
VTLPDSNPDKRPTVRWWEAGGLHVHITYPDGSWERRVFKRDDWHSVDALVLDVKRIGGIEV